MKNRFLVLLLALSACASKDPVERGRSYFVNLGCITCHRVGDQGGGQTGPDLTTIGLRKTPEWLDIWLQDPHKWKPGTAMPNFNLKPAVRADLIAYMGTLKGELYRPNAPWDTEELKANPVKRGEVIFNRAGCVGCHGTAGKGGFPNNNVVGGLIPGLTLAADGYSKPELHDKIAKGVVPEAADHNAPAPMIHMPEWRQYLKPDEIDALVEYIYSLRPAAAPGSDWSE